MTTLYILLALLTLVIVAAFVAIEVALRKHLQFKKQVFTFMCDSINADNNGASFKERARLKTERRILYERSK